MSTFASLTTRNSGLLNLVQHLRARCLAAIRGEEVHCAILDGLLAQLHHALQKLTTVNLATSLIADLCDEGFATLTHELRQTLEGIQDELESFGPGGNRRELSRETRVLRLSTREVPELIEAFVAELDLLHHVLQSRTLANVPQVADESVDNLYLARDVLYELLAEGRPLDHRTRRRSAGRPVLSSHSVNITTVRCYSAGLILGALEEEHRKIAVQASNAEAHAQSTVNLRRSIYWYAQSRALFQKLGARQGTTTQTSSNRGIIHRNTVTFLMASLKCLWLAQLSLEDRHANLLLLYTSSLAVCSICESLRSVFSSSNIEWTFEDIQRYDSFTLKIPALVPARGVTRSDPHPTQFGPPIDRRKGDGYSIEPVPRRPAFELPATSSRQPLWRDSGGGGATSQMMLGGVPARQLDPAVDFPVGGQQAYANYPRINVQSPEGRRASTGASLSMTRDEDLHYTRTWDQAQVRTTQPDRDTRNFDITSSFRTMTLQQETSGSLNAPHSSQTSSGRSRDIRAVEPPSLRPNEVEISRLGVQDPSQGLNVPFHKGVYSLDSEPAYSFRWTPSSVYVFKRWIERGDHLRLWTERTGMPTSEVSGLLAEVELVPVYAFTSAERPLQEIDLRSGGMPFGLKYRFDVARANGRRDVDELFAFQSALMSASLECEYPVAEIAFESQTTSIDLLRPARMQLWVEDKIWSSCPRQSDSSSGSSDSKMILRRHPKVPFQESFEDFEGAKLFIYSNGSIYVILVTDRIVRRASAPNTLKLLPNRQIGCSSVQVRKLQGSPGALAGIPLDQSGLQFSDLDGPLFTSYTSVTIKFLGRQDAVLEGFEKDFQDKVQDWKKRRSKTQDFRDHERNLRLSPTSELHRRH